MSPPDVVVAGIYARRVAGPLCIGKQMRHLAGPKTATAGGCVKTRIRDAR